MTDLVVFAIRPLPDFLVDHTLAAERGPEQLKEVLARWVNFVASLGVWAGRASFGLRFISGAGRIDAFLFAVPLISQGASELASEVEAMLRTHRLVTDPAASRVDGDLFIKASELRKPAFAAVVQRTIRGLWQPPARFQPTQPRPGVGDPSGAALAPGGPRAGLGSLHLSATSASPGVVLPWRGPGGPFLIPMEAMLLQPIRSCVTVHLMPTHLLGEEVAWLQSMAMAAQSVSDETLQRIGVASSTRQVDPAAALAGRIYESSLNRLTSSAFVSLVHIGAEYGRRDVLRGIVSALRTQPLEHPLVSADPDAALLPSASDELDLGTSLDLRLHKDLDFTSAVRDATADRDPAARLPMLTDAYGAATLFRLPVSIRGGVPGMEVRQLPPDFRPGPRKEQAASNEVLVGRLRDGGVAEVRVNDLTRHILVTGFTGTGKTVTVLNLLHQLWIDHAVPFLVLESAKAEYRGFIGVRAFADRGEPLRVYTLGNERAVPLRLNPFELIPGVRVEAHISRLQACVEAAIPPVGPSSSIIAEALVDVYKQNGWEITDEAPLEWSPRRRFPIFAEFVATVERLIQSRGYRGELKDNLQAAIVGRFRPLLLGGKGRLLNARRCDPDLETLFTKPVVLEMNDLNLDDKALVTMFVLSLLREFRERRRGDGERLVHLTVVEEAHNVLEDVGSKGSGEGATSADTRYQAVQAFCSMLAEIRSLGEGILIADQSPQKLARDAIRNTNLQIAHQLRDAEDRDAIAEAMIMEEEQRDFLGKLGRGQAAMFRTGLEKATFITVPQYYPNPSQALGRTAEELAMSFRGFGFRTDLADADVIRHMMNLDRRDRREQPTPLQGCEHCGSRCNEAFRDAAFSCVDNGSGPAMPAYRAWYEVICDRDRMKSLGWNGSIALGRARDLCRDAAAAASLPDHVDAHWCVYVHAWAACSAHPLRAGLKPADVVVRHSHRERFIQATVQGSAPAHRA